ncbi:MAG: 1-acyl-sn-glycerol-3-phosphate acyltransferase [Alphaproteobacteria bacterium]|nr:1-acyl-sn-glycerol-3-phosphate acyltransferase [Alphaproteobacteria bacterium]
MRLIGSIFFMFCYFLSTVFICTWLHLFFWAPVCIKLIGAIVWGHSVAFGLRVFCNVKIRVEGKENIPSGNKFIVASKHQSALETMYLFTIFPRAVFVLKKELLFLPFFGLSLLIEGSIPIDRKSGTKAMRKMLKYSEKRLAKHRPVIIFPEGTRRPVGAEPLYNPGVGFLYEKLNVPVVPVALNTGVCWPKNAFLKNKGTVVFKILPVIEPGMPKREFLKEVQSKIEDACNKL